MKRKFSIGLVIALAMSGVFGGVSFAADSPAPAIQQAAAAPKVAIPGAPSKYAPLTAADKMVFKKAPIPVGVTYEPLVVNKQVVSGMKYNFFCNAKAVYPKAQWYAAMVSIDKPASGDTTVKIQKIETP